MVSPSQYPTVPFHPLIIFRLKGSIFLRSLPLSLLCAALAYFFKFSADKLSWGNFLSEAAGSGAYNAVSVLVGFLVIFRTQQCYIRFWEGAGHLKTMQSEIFSTGSNLVAFCRRSKRPAEEIDNFIHLLIRLLSLLFAACMWELRGRESVSTEVIDLAGLDENSLKTLANSNFKVQLLIQWVQSITIDADSEGIINVAPPILTRIFQNLSCALGAFFSATRMREVRYPFAYAQTTDMLILVHLILTPVCMINFTGNPEWASLYSFCIAIMLVSLNNIAAEIENPFGAGSNDLNLVEMLQELNEHLLLLANPSTRAPPYISDRAISIDVGHLASGTFNILDGSRLAKTFGQDAIESGANVPALERRQKSADSLRPTNVAKTWTQVTASRFRKTPITEQVDQIPEIIEMTSSEGVAENDAPPVISGFISGKEDDGNVDSQNTSFIMFGQDDDDDQSQNTSQNTFQKTPSSTPRVRFADGILTPNSSMRRCSGRSPDVVESTHTYPTRRTSFVTFGAGLAPPSTLDVMGVPPEAMISSSTLEVLGALANPRSSTRRCSGLFEPSTDLRTCSTRRTSFVTFGAGFAPPTTLDGLGVPADGNLETRRSSKLDVLGAPADGNLAPRLSTRRCSGRSESNADSHTCSTRGRTSLVNFSAGETERLNSTNCATNV